MSVVRPPPVTTLYGDRFISTRTEGYPHRLEYTEKQRKPTTLPSPFENALAYALFDGPIPSCVQSFGKSTYPLRNGFDSPLRTLYAYNQYTPVRVPPAANRPLEPRPFKVLDAPGFIDNHTHHPLDWSSDNVLAVALGRSVYLYNATTRAIDRVFKTHVPCDYVTSVAWSNKNELAISTSQTKIFMWDCHTRQETRHFSYTQQCATRISCLAWNPKEAHILSAAGNCTHVFIHDTRAKGNGIIHSALKTCTHVVYGLAWSPSGQQLASGADNPIVNVWEPFQSSSSSRTVKPFFQLQGHLSGVRALAWCPWKSHVLATGGWSGDPSIRFWNTRLCTAFGRTETPGQVTSIQWSRSSRELVSSHGFSSNQLTVWKYPSMRKIGHLVGHEGRPLDTALSPDGTTIVSIAGDGAIRFWKVFDACPPVKKSPSATAFIALPCIR